jgi:shikimate kinase
MTERIFLIGFMGSGKTTHGKRLARALDWRFVDMDERIRELTGLSIPEIFRDHGEDYFRMKEEEVLLSLCERKQVVVSTGGGAPCYRDNMQKMNDSGLTIYIKLPPGALLDRLVKSKTSRPLLDGKTEGEMQKTIVELLASREPYYNRAAVIIDGHADVVDRILRIL